MVRILKYLESVRGRIVGGLFLVTSGIIAYVSLAQPVLSPTSIFWKETWNRLTFQSIAGTAVVISWFLLAIAYLAPLLWRVLNRRPLYPHVYLALSQAGNEIRDHMTEAIVKARPTNGNRQAISLWDQLAAAALLGHAQGKVIVEHCEEGNSNRPVIFCNFRGYAHAVGEVLNLLPHLRFLTPYPHVWTLLKRSIFEWYNPFPLISGQAVGRITLAWWEEYKASVAKLKTTGRIHMRRIVAHPPLAPGWGQVGEYNLYSNALDLSEAKLASRSHNSYIQWLPSVDTILRADAKDAPRGTSIYLIGRPQENSGDGTPRTSSKVVEHFYSTFHSGSECALDEHGVFLRYLTNVNRYKTLLAYDDMFVVQLSPELVFGLAFIDDESRDINGMRILSRYQMLSVEPNSPGLLDLLHRAWADGEGSFRVCEGLSPCP